MNDIKEKNEPITQDEQEMGSRYIIIKIEASSVCVGK